MGGFHTLSFSISAYFCNCVLISVGRLGVGPVLSNTSKAFLVFCRLLTSNRRLLIYSCRAFVASCLVETPAGFISIYMVQRSGVSSISINKGENFSFVASSKVPILLQEYQVEVIQRTLQFQIATLT